MKISATRLAALASLLATLTWQLPGAEQIQVQTNLVYGRANGVDLVMDLARPVTGKGPFPAVVFVHGGGWWLGRRTDNGYSRMIREFARQGFVAATIDYRLAPKHKWPAQIEDCKCAVRYLRAHAQPLQVDSKRIGALGDSAGGHLVLLLGLMDATDGLEGKGGWAGYSSKVQAVANYYGPADLKNWHVTPLAEPFIKKIWGTDSTGVIQGWLGTADRQSKTVAQASPVTYITPSDPPIITFQGTLDPLVPESQSQILHAGLRKAKVPERLVIIPFGLHGWGGDQRVQTDRQALEFFQKQFKKN